MAGERQPILELRGIVKRFGGVTALRGVDFALYDGELVAIIGDNGAGKSTLIKIISGVYTPDEGEVVLWGKPVKLRSPDDARRYGIETVHQTLALADHMDVVGNFFLGRELTRGWYGPLFHILNRPAMEKRTREVLADLEVDIPSLRTPVKALSGGQRQGIALGRAIAFGQKILILDEPTAALGLRETRKVVDLILRLKAQKVPIIMISHSLPIVFEVADRIVIMRNGQVVGERDPARTAQEELLALMVGTKEVTAP